MCEMPTKHQAQVKMTPKVRTGPVRRESEALAPTSGSPSFVDRKKPVPIRAVTPLHIAADVRNESKFAPSAAPGRRLAYQIAKRTFDLVIGSGLLLIATPLILIAAIAIRLETTGSPFFIQTRLGKNGKPFKIVKLRGMFIDARTQFASYYDYSKHCDLEFCFHHEEDPRVTRAGKFIRKTSIDELPNLWNVVLGDMSLVGPRPEIPEVLALYGPYRDEYVSVKPGVTCLSKVTGRDRLTKRETIEFDLGYIRKRSFALDFQILWKTIRGVMLRRDVF